MDEEMHKNYEVKCQCDRSHQELSRNWRWEDDEINSLSGRTPASP